MGGLYRTHYAWVVWESMGTYLLGWWARPSRPAQDNFSHCRFCCCRHNRACAAAPRTLWVHCWTGHFTFSLFSCAELLIRIDRSGADFFTKKKDMDRFSHHTAHAKTFNFHTGHSHLHQVFSTLVVGSHSSSDHGRWSLWCYKRLGLR